MLGIRLGWRVYRDAGRRPSLGAGRNGCPHVVFHTAALKHLTLLEQYPEEGRKTNVEGSRNLLDAGVGGSTHDRSNPLGPPIETSVAARPR